MTDSDRAASSSIMKPASNPLMCPICYEEYDDAENGKPIILTSCGHTSCKSCVFRLAVDADNGSVTCPKCRAPSRLDHGLVVNYSVLQIATDAKRNVCDGNGIRCCRHDGRLCCAFCWECNRWLCADCLSFVEPETGDAAGEDFGHVAAHHTMAVTEIGARIEAIQKKLEAKAKIMHDELMTKVEDAFLDFKSRIHEIRRMQMKYSPTPDEQLECLKAAQKLEDLVAMSAHFVHNADFYLPTQRLANKSTTSDTESDAEWLRIKDVVIMRMAQVSQQSVVDVEAAAEELVHDLKNELLCHACDNDFIDC